MVCVDVTAMKIGISVTAMKIGNSVTAAKMPFMFLSLRIMSFRTVRTRWTTHKRASVGYRLTDARQERARALLSVTVQIINLSAHHIGQRSP